MDASWKVLVISDTHDRTKLAEQVIDAIQDHIDAVYFLGDYLTDGQKLSRKYPQLAFLCMAGNCDFTNQNLFADPEILGHRLYLCHGHHHGVKEGYEQMRRFASTNGYEVVLCGHTHEPYAEEAEGHIILNPGSIGMPFPVYGRDFIVLKLEKDKKPAYMFGNSTKPFDEILEFLDKN